MPVHDHPKMRRCRLPMRWLICLLALLLTLSACGGGGNIPADTVGETESASSSESTEGDTGGETSPEQPPEEKYPGDAAAYEGLMIAAVYGTGDKTDAAMEAGFVQLYNAADHDISLDGASLYYKNGGKSAYKTFALPADVTVPAGGYYLIRTSTVPGYDASMAVLGIEHYDTTWDISFDNKEIRLLLAPNGWLLDSTDDLITDGEDILDRAISSFVASTTYTNIGCAVDDLSKNKIAVRTALTDYSGFHTVNLTRRATPELKQLATRTLDGRVNEVLSTRLDEVTFSHDAGVYSESFLLELSAPEGYTIYYTLDGSDPTSSTSIMSRKQYKGGLSMEDSSAMAWGSLTLAWNRYFANTGRNDTNWYDPTPAVSTQLGARVVKAYATDGTNSTPVYTNTYFINPTMADYDVPVVSISLATSEIIGHNGFYSNFMPTGSMAGLRPRGTGMIEIFSPDGERVGHSMVEMAVSGNGSSHGGMKSLRIYYKGTLNETGGLESNLDYDIFGGRAVDAYGNAITSFDRFLLRNAGNDNGWSHFRDPYIQRAAAGLNIDTQASAVSLVFINGEFWGVYNIRERYSPEYVESHYGVNKDNVTIIESDYGALVYEGNSAAPYVDSSGVTGQAALFNELYDYIIGNEMSDVAHYAYVTERLDVDSLIDLWAIRLFFCARDWPENNIKIWRNTNPDDPSGVDTKWHFVLLDTDMGMSFYPTGDPNADTSEDSKEIFRLAFESDNRCSRMMKALLGNADFRQQFILRYYELATEVFTPEYLHPLLDEIIAEWDSFVTLQKNRWPNDSDDGYFPTRREEAIRLMERFIDRRLPYALEHFYDYLDTSEEEIKSMLETRTVVSFNEAQVSVTVNGATVHAGDALQNDLKTNTWQVVATALDGCSVTSIEWVSMDGTSQLIEGTSAVFEAAESGALIIHSGRSDASDDLADGSIIAGATYLFYLSSDGDLYAWGDNRHGVLGLNLPINTVPTPTFVMSNVAKVETSRGTDYEDGCTEFMTAIVTKDGKLYTVGVNTLGQLGRNGQSSDRELGQVKFSGEVVDVSVGHDHTLVLDANGALWGVGSNSNGQLGQVGNGGSTTGFIRVASRVADMTAGRRSTTYITTDGTLYGLGDNRWNKLSETTDKESISTPVKMMKGIAFIAAGEHQSVAVSESGQLYYAGWRNLSSFVDRTGNAQAMSPVMAQVVKADVYFSDMVILDKNGCAFVYGLNNQGAIGDRSVTGGAPQKILDGVADVAAGYGFTAYLMQDGRILVQGSNALGQAGNGTVGGTATMTVAKL